MDVSLGSAIVCFCLLFADSGEKTRSVSGPTPPNMAETRASTHPEDPPSQSDTLHWSQVHPASLHTHRHNSELIVQATHLWFYLQ